MVVSFRCLGALLALCLMAGCGPTDRERESSTPDVPRAPMDLEAEDGMPAETPASAVADGDASSTGAAEKEGAPGVAEDPDQVPAPEEAALDGLPPDAQWQTWSQSLTGGTPDARRSAADAITRTLTPFSPDQVAGLLKHESSGVRRCAAFYLLERFDPNDSKSAAAMAGALSDDDATVRHIALSAVRRLPAAKLVLVVPQLTAILKSPQEDATNRASIVRLLGGLERQAESALPLLVEILQTDPDASVRSAAAVAIPRMADPAQAADWLRQALAKESDPTVQTVLVVRLGRIGSPAAAAVEVLAGTLSTSDQELQRRVIDALIAIGEPSVPQLIELLKSPNVQFRRLAVFALGRLGTVAASAAEPLKACLNDEDAEVRQLAEIALLRVQSSR
ncbi:MAG: HEAT repeat domain-containing protein [Pirellulaceae bacterium]|nr:HEAT repeat domain-containing protein [Pirellulaceae bacterium]